MSSYKIDSSLRAKYYGGSRSLSSIKYIVLHYTGNSGTTATAKGNANYFKECPRKASAHYVVDTKNVIYRCVPDENSAYAVGDTQTKRAGGGTLKGICTNSNSISIEMVSCSDANGKYYIPEQTQNYAAELVRDLMKKYNIDIKHICRHADVTYKDCPNPMSPYTQEGISNWNNFLNKVKNNQEKEKSEDGEPMTVAERQEMDSLKKKVEELSKQNKVYHYWTEIPSWALPTLQKLKAKNLFAGASESDLNIPESTLKTLVINDRAGLYG